MPWLRYHAKPYEGPLDLFSTATVVHAFMLLYNRPSLHNPRGLGIFSEKPIPHFPKSLKSLFFGIQSPATTHGVKAESQPPTLTGSKAKQPPLQSLQQSRKLTKRFGRLLALWGSLWPLPAFLERGSGFGRLVGLKNCETLTFGVEH